MESPPHDMVNTPYLSATHNTTRGLHTPCHAVSHDGAERLLATRVALQRMAKVRPTLHFDDDGDSHRRLVVTRKTLQMAAKVKESKMN